MHVSCVYACNLCKGPWHVLESCGNSVTAIESCMWFACTSVSFRQLVKTGGGLFIYLNGCYVLANTPPGMGQVWKCCGLCMIACFISEDVSWRTCYCWFLIWLIYECRDCEGVLSCARHLDWFSQFIHELVRHSWVMCLCYDWFRIPASRHQLFRLMYRVQRPDNRVIAATTECETVL